VHLCSPANSVRLHNNNVERDKSPLDRFVYEPHHIRSRQRIRPSEWKSSFQYQNQPGDLVSGRVVEVAGDCVLAELGEGIRATCRIAKPARQEHSESEQPGADKPDVKSLSSMLAARWKAGSVAESPKAQEVRAAQVRSFRITTLDPAARKIEVELVSKLRIQCSQTLHHARPAVRGFCKAIG